MKIRFWGTRGSVPVPGKETMVFGGNTTCLEITLESGKKVIIDAGTGIRGLGDKLIECQNTHEVYLLFTHIHWDHVLGFPFFSPVYSPSFKIKIDGFPTCMKGLKVIFDAKMGDGFFPVNFNDLKANIQYIDQLRYGSLYIDGVVIDKIILQHPQSGFGFRLREKGQTIVFITDNELRNESNSIGFDDYARFADNADILIHDAQYLPEEISFRKGWGHSDYESALKLANKSQVGKLFLFHHDPARNDQQMLELEQNCKKLLKGNKGLIIEAAKEGDEVSTL